MLSYEDRYKLAVQLIQKGYLIHCTSAVFDSFDSSFIKGGMRAKEGYGFYFTDMPYKALDYGSLFKVIKKDDFNFLDSSDKIDISLFYDDALEVELAKIEAALDNVRNIHAVVLLVNSGATGECESGESCDNYDNLFHITYLL